jgi:Haemolysin-III related
MASRPATTTSIKASAFEVTEIGRQAASKSADDIQRILHWDELPQWMQKDPYIRRGYRRQLDSFRACFWSLFYPHNELINIWSHLLPAMFYLAILLAANYSSFHGGIEVSTSDHLMMQMYVAGTAGCLFLSVGCSYLMMFPCTCWHAAA